MADNAAMSSSEAREFMDKIKVVYKFRVFNFEGFIFLRNFFRLKFFFHGVQFLRHFFSPV